MDTFHVLIYIVSFIGIFTTVFYVLSLISDKRNPKILNDKLFSATVLIPAYNEEASIEKTIESIIASDYPKELFEIIVINDGSKDKTYELAKKFESSSNPRVTVLTKENGGKGSALNLGLRRAKGKIIFTMDADTFVDKNAMRQMMKQFYSEKVMSVTPGMGVYNPKTILQRIQHIEYSLGVFLRKAFSNVNSIHVTPGAFSAYRKEFFDKYGGYEEHNITEDTEVALRIQKNQFWIENAPDAVIFTIAPANFRELLYQRRRWYSGFIRNMLKYNRLIHPRYGILGMILLPLASLSALFTITLTSDTIIRASDSLRGVLNSLSAVNFSFKNYTEFSWFTIKHFIYTILSEPLVLLSVIFFISLLGTVLFARKKLGFKESFKWNLVFFVCFYALLHSFWWIMSYIYLIFNRNIVWRKSKDVKI